MEGNELLIPMIMIRMTASEKLFYFAAWGDNEENLLQAMKKTRDHAVLAPLAEKLEAPNAIHLWREV